MFQCGVTRRVDVDYLVVGAGAMGMGFVDRRSTTPTYGSRWSSGPTASAGIGGTRTPSSDCTSRRPSTASRRVCSPAVGSSDRAGGGALRARGRADHLRVLRPGARRADGRAGARRVLSGVRLRGRSRVRLPRVRRALRGAGAVPGRRRPLPRAGHPGGIAAEIRGGRRRPRHRGQRPSRGEGTSGPYVSSAPARPRRTAASGCWARASSRTICWVRPRDPWMLNRALIEPDPPSIWA